MRTSSRSLPALLQLLALAALLFGARAHATTPRSGQLQWHDKAGHLQRLASLDTDVEYHVSGLVAEVQVRQKFRNTGNDWLESEYVLPLPSGAAVYSMSLEIGERRIVAGIKRKQAARQAFERARSSGRQAALVEADNANLFHTAVTNVAPGEVVTIVLHYWQRVGYESGTYSLRFPLTFTPRYHMTQGAPAGPSSTDAAQVFVDDSAAAPLRTQIAVQLDAGMPLAQVASPSHAIVSTHSGSSWQIHLREGRVVPDRDFVLRWSPQALTQPNLVSFTQHIDGSDYAMLMLMPPQQSAQRLPRELILVLDTSGSMGGASIRQARSAMDLALSQLQPGDRFNVVEFNSIMNPWRPAAVPATRAAVQQARTWVSARQAGGGTEMEPALRFALAGHAPAGYVRQVLFATDGAVNNPDRLMRLIDQQLGDSRLFPIGIGSAPNAEFLQAAARHGRGSATVISDPSQLGASMLQLLAKLTHPALRDLKIDWPAGTEAYPRQLPDLYLGEPLVVIAKLPPGVSRVQVHGELADRAWTTPADLSTPAPAEGLDRLWAKSRMADLKDQLARGGDAKELVEAITQTALTAHLVSDYTSLIAVDQTPSRSADAALRHARLPNVMPAGTHFARATPGDASFAQTATAAELELWLAMLALLLAGLAWSMQRRTPGAWAVETFEAKKWLREDRFSTIHRPMVVPWAKNRRKYGPRRRFCSPEDFYRPGS